MKQGAVTVPGTSNRYHSIHLIVYHAWLVEVLTRKLLGQGAAAEGSMALAFSQAQKTLSTIRSMIPRLVTSGVVVAGEPTLYVEPANVPAVCDFLKSHTGTRTKQLMDVTAVDVPTRDKRFEVCCHVGPCAQSDHIGWTSQLSGNSRIAQVIYQLLSVEHNSRMRIKTLVGGHEGDGGVPSVADIFSSAKWLEREVWDMYGIYFGNSSHSGNRPPWPAWGVLTLSPSLRLPLRVHRGPSGSSSHPHRLWLSGPSDAKGLPPVWLC